MIRVYNTQANIFAEFEGSIKEKSVKRNYVEQMSIYGKQLSEYVRGVVDLDITIKHIDNDNYELLKSLFFFHNNLKIENTDKGKEYSSYCIKGETLSLDEYEDFDNKTYYYKGGISLSKI